MHDNTPSPDGGWQKFRPGPYRELIYGVDAALSISLETRPDGDAVMNARNTAYSATATRLILECGLLGGLTDAEICETGEVSSSLVSAYAELFFDVRPHLEDPEWIDRKAIGNELPSNPTISVLFQVARWLSHRGGPAFTPMLIPLLDELLAFARDLGWYKAAAQSDTRRRKLTRIESQVLRSVRRILDRNEMLTSTQLQNECEPVLNRWRLGDPPSLVERSVRFVWNRLTTLWRGSAKPGAN